LRGLSRGAAVKAAARRALRALSGFGQGAQVQV
jgi:hypothetical protein